MLHLNGAFFFNKMKTIIILHNDSLFDKEILTRWLNSFSDLVGIIVINESKDIVKRRIKFEIKRSGIFGFFDILLFRIFYKLKYSKLDNDFLNNIINEYKTKFELPKIDFINTNSINDEKVKDFIESKKVDIVLARCKQLIKKDIYNLPKKGTYVLHPGITPKYRNAYGLFWAIYNKDYDNVGTTLLKIDDGIDTGPIYEYVKHNWNLETETINQMQINSVYLNLDNISEKLIQIYNEKAVVIIPEKSRYKLYGQIHFTKFLKVLLRK